MPMLTLLVPGVGMGGGGAPSSATWKLRITLANPSATEPIPAYFRHTVKLAAGDITFSVPASDGGDLAVYDDDETTPVDFWLSHWDVPGESAYLEIELPYMLAPLESRDVWLYYGGGAGNSDWDASYTSAAVTSNTVIYGDGVGGAENYSGWPGCVILPSGDIVVTYRAAADHNNANSNMRVSRSSNGGATWTHSLVWSDTNNTRDGRGLFRRSDGRLFWPYFFTSGASNVAKYRYSDDGGVSWSSAQDIANPFSDSLVTYGTTRELTDGTLLMPVYGWNVGQMFRSALLQSTDNGATWTLRSTILYDGVRHYDETAIWYYEEDDRVVAVVRSDPDQTLYQTVSTDGGMTWGAATLLGAGVSPDLLLLPSGGLLLTYGERASHPYAIVSRVSYDRGATWHTTRELFDQQAPGGLGANSGYPCCQIMADGETIFGAYYDNDSRGSTFTSVKRMTFTEPKVTGWDNFYEGVEAGDLSLWENVTGIGTAASSARPHHDDWHLRINDTDVGTLNRARKVFFPTIGAQARGVSTHWVYVQSSTNGIIAALMDAANVSRFQILINPGPGCEVQWLNSSSVYTSFSNPQSAVVGAWNKFQLHWDSSGQSFQLFLNGVNCGAGGRFTLGGSISKIQITSGSTAGTGDFFDVDDVYFDSNWSLAFPSVTIGDEEEILPPVVATPPLVCDVVEFLYTHGDSVEYAYTQSDELNFDDCGG
jgi:hypothetical protein